MYILITGPLQHPQILEHPLNKKDARVSNSMPGIGYISEWTYWAVCFPQMWRWPWTEVPMLALSLGAQQLGP